MCIEFRQDVDWEEADGDIKAFKVVSVDPKGRLMSLRKPSTRKRQTDALLGLLDEWQNGKQGTDMEYRMGEVALSALPGIYLREVLPSASIMSRPGRFMILEGAVPRGAVYRRSGLTSSICATHFIPTGILADWENH